MAGSSGISRRDALRTLVGTPLMASSCSVLAQATSAEVGVVPTSRCFLIGGKPEFLISGSIHYFRVPHQLWRDRLLRAKRAGLNCIETYVAWNFHEPQEGIYRFDGDRDIEEFFRACRECGLYAFVRPGPFICSEWDSGGYPAWLIGKPGSEFRTTNSVAQRYIRRWFEQLVPRIARHQVSQGGPVILVQSENEYFFCDIPGGREYLQFLNGTLRDLGIEVPITDCNGLNANVSGSLKTVNSGDPGVVPEFRKKYPQIPVFLSEFWIGSAISFWDQPLQQRPVQEVRQVTMEALASGAMFNFYMFHGGTNFGVWGSNSVHSDHSWMTTRYDFTAPVAEGGALNEKYFAVKCANLLGNNFREFFCHADPAPDPVRVDGPVRLKSWRSPQGYLSFVLPRYPERSHLIWRLDGHSPFFTEPASGPGEEIAKQPGVLQLLSGQSVPLAEGSAYPMMLPVRFKLNSACRIDFSNATLLGYGGEGRQTVAVLLGEAGRQGIISINGQECRFVLPSDEPLRLTVGGVRVFALSREMADRTWFADGRVLMGPAYVGEFENGRHECWLDGTEKVVHVVSARGEYTKVEVQPRPVPTVILRPTGWTGRVLPETKGKGEGWRQIEGPRSVEELGGYYGYTWYRASFRADRGRSSSLFFTRAADRIHVFSKGRKIGVWGRGNGAERGPIPVEVDPGSNEFTFLCDNMGRSSEGQAHDRKGIWAGVYLDAVRRPFARVQWDEVNAPPRAESWQFKTYRCRDAAPGFRFTRFRAAVPFSTGEDALLAFRWVSQFAWVYVNGQFVGEHPGNEALANGCGFSEFVLDPYLSSHEMQVELCFFGEPSKEVVEHVHLIAYPRPAALTNWRFKTFEEPLAGDSAETGTLTWWECQFARPKLLGPLFLATEGLSKGQIYLNGNAIGRYWNVGPQYTLYLPEPWIQDRNRLVILDEEGRRPDGVYIMRDSRYPTRSISI